MNRQPLQNRRNVLSATLASALLALAGLSSPVSAQEKYPEKPIRILVGFSAGGPTDVVARKLAARIEPLLGSRSSLKTGRERRRRSRPANWCVPSLTAIRSTSPARQH